MSRFADAHDDGRKAVEGFDVAEIGLFKAGHHSPCPMFPCIDRPAYLSVAPAGPNDVFIGGRQTADRGVVAGGQHPDGLGMEGVVADDEQE